MLPPRQCAGLSAGVGLTKGPILSRKLCSFFSHFSKVCGVGSRRLKGDPQACYC